MAIKVGNTYKCMFCEYRNNNPSLVNDHQHQVHDFALLPITKEEINKLIMYIFVNGIDQKLISEDLYKRLKAYGKFRIKPPEDE